MPSVSVRDITITASYRCETDVVRATGIWVYKTNFRAVKAANPDTLSPHADYPGIRAGFKWCGENLGATHIDPKTNNGMEMEFTVAPSGIGLEPGITFDITRNKESVGWKTIGDNVIPQVEPPAVPSSFPAYKDTPNDDPPGYIDEDNDPRVYLNSFAPPFLPVVFNTDHIYSIDCPGRAGNNADADRHQLRSNFNEFVRVKVNGGTFAETVVNPQTGAGAVEGSRVSSFVPWRSRMDIRRDPNNPVTWIRNNVAGENEIVEDHKPLGNQA